MYCVGYATDKEIAELERRGWEVEDAEDYNLVGEDPEFLVGPPGVNQDGERHKVIVVFVDSSVFKVMDGPDWDKG